MTVKRLPNGARHTLETIAERSVKSGRCLIWQGATMGGDQFEVPAIKDQGKTVPLRTYIFTELLGQTVPDGKVVSFRCRNRLCVEATHIKAMTRHQVTRHAVELTGYNKSAGWLAKCTAAGRKHSGIDPDLIERVRQAEGSNRQVARELNLSRHFVDGIRCGRTWVQANPFTGLGARQAANDPSERKRA